MPLLRLHQFLGLEEALEMFHLPDARDDEDERLCDGPPQHSLVGALAGHAEALLAILVDTQTYDDGDGWLGGAEGQCAERREEPPVTLW